MARQRAKKPPPAKASPGNGLGDMRLKWVRGHLKHVRGCVRLIGQHMDDGAWFRVWKELIALQVWAEAAKKDFDIFYEDECKCPAGRKQAAEDFDAAAKERRKT